MAEPDDVCPICDGRPRRSSGEWYDIKHDAECFDWVCKNGIAGMWVCLACGGTGRRTDFAYRTLTCEFVREACIDVPF